MLSFWSVVLSFLALSLTNAQVPGTDICSCSPTSFTFTINLDGTCPGDVATGGGIERVTCVVSNLAFQPVENETPVVIRNIDVFEIGPDLSLLKQERFPGTDEDGFTFTYTSVSAPGDLTADTVPIILQISIRAENSEGTVIRNSLGVVYTNDCNVEPIFVPNAQFGWVTLVRVVLHVA